MPLTTVYFRFFRCTTLAICNAPVFFLLLMLFVIRPASAADEGGGISGTIYMSDGITPVTGLTDVGVSVMRAENGINACQAMLPVNTNIDTANGTFTLSGLEPGQYYVTIWTNSSSNYIREYWDASGQSVRNCADADPVTVIQGQTETDKNLQIEEGGGIAGTLFMSDGLTPITGLSNIGVMARRSDNGCTAEPIATRAVDPQTGAFILNGLEPGPYYLQVSVSGDVQYIVEHWDASGQSVRNCAEADPVTVTQGQTTTGKNFQLEEGGSITGTLFMSDGITPLTGQADVGVRVMKAEAGVDACEAQDVTGVNINVTTGTFTINGLEPGQYYLSTWANANSDYIREFWDASGQSVRNCAEADPVTVTQGQTTSGKNFQLEEGGSISGTLFMSDGTTPLTGQADVGVRVMKAEAGVDACEAQDVTGVNINVSTGTFAINGLESGQYYLTIWANANSDYIREYWDASGQSVRNCAEADPVTVTQGQTTSGKNFQLEEGGTITGTLFMSDGITPLTGQSGLGVRLFRAEEGVNACEADEVTGVNIDPSTGTFVIGGLEPGQYYLASWANDNANYIQEYWGASDQSVRDCADAAPVTVTQGQTISGGNFQLEEGGAIAGSLLMSDGITPITGKSDVGVRVMRVEEGVSACQAQEVQGTDINTSNGSFTLSALEPGQYYLTIWTDDSSMYIQEYWNSSGQSVRNCADAEPITVTQGQTAIDRNLQLDEGGGITGTLFMSDGITPITGIADIGVMVRRGENGCTAEHIKGHSVDPQTGAFMLNGLEPGLYYLQVSVSGNVHYIVEHWDVSGQSVRNCADADPITVSQGQVVSGRNFQLEEGGSISGTFFQSNGSSPLTGQSGLGANLWRGDNACETEHVKGTNLESDGTFLLAGLEAGTYYLKAFNQGTSDYIEEYWDASGQSVRNCAEADPITVSQGQTVPARNFQLELGGAIAGTVYDSGGLAPLTNQNFTITARRGENACNNAFVKSAQINADGTYVIHGLEPGSYWVKNNNGDTVYWEEYYRSERSVHFIECPLAEAVSVVQGITTPAINFQLDVDTAGDIDLDGTRDLRDLILALQIAAGESVQLDEAAAEHADFDGNGRIGIHEVIMLLNVLADR